MGCGLTIPSPINTSGRDAEGLLQVLSNSAIIRRIQGSTAGNPGRYILQRKPIDKTQQLNSIAEGLRESWRRVLPRSGCKYRVLQKKLPPKTFRNNFTSVKCFCVKFCKFVGNSYPDASTNFCRFILIFHQTALIFPRVPYPSFSPCQVLSIRPQNENAVYQLGK